MLELQTPRLRLVPLPSTELEMLVKDRQALEKRLQLTVTDYTPDQHFQTILRQFILPAVQQDPENYHWHTDWQIILRAENRIIGSFGFKGGPKSDGEVEIGYGTQPPYQNCGYTTEALRTAIEWVSLFPGITSLVADTLKDNFPSMRVLEKLDFTRFGQSDELYHWRLPLG